MGNEIKTNKNKSRLSSNTKSWLTTIGIVILISVLIYVMTHYKTFTFYMLTILAISITSFGLWMIKEIIREKLFDDEQYYI